MIGAIAGDMIGSPYESRPVKTVAFPLAVDAFTDDTVLTVAVANAILRRTGYRSCIACFARSFPNLPYGGSFWHWIWDPDSLPYYSFGNGSAMRVSPVGFAFESVDAMLADPEIDAVSICTPSGLHLEPALAAAAAGKSL